MTTSQVNLANKPRPSDYGLPYEEWWPGQLEAIGAVNAALADVDNRAVMLLADTGTGKTGIATAISQSFRTTSVLTSTISLEEQYEQVAKVEVGRGRKWHECLLGQDPLKCFEAEECYGPCPYKLHISRMYNQKLRVWNYAQFFALNQASKTNWGTDLVVCDEAQNVENAIQSFVEMWYEDEMPTWGHEYSDKLLFPYGKKFLFMSATMIPALVADTVGIDKYVVVEATNNFESDFNPVYVTPVGYISARTPHIDRIVRRIDSHISTTTLSGVIHTASDAQTEEILASVKNPERFIWPKGPSRASQFQFFKEHPNQGLVLISASGYEGQDYPGDMCRWQIICKVPYASLGSPLVRARREQRPEIYQLEALQKVQQACGRGARTPDDWCVNYILDASVLKLYEKFGGLLTQRFRNSWKGVQDRDG